VSLVLLVMVPLADIARVTCLANVSKLGGVNMPDSPIALTHVVTVIPRINLLALLTEGEVMNVICALMNNQVRRIINPKP
jgi:hypothetical protein